jgi:hypothetical protein
MEAHMARTRTWTRLLLGAGCAALMAGSASAAIVTNSTPVDFTGGSVSLGFGTNDITFTDISGGAFTFDSVGVSTTGGGAVSYLSFFGAPSTFFDPIRGSGSLTFDGTTQFASLPSTTTIGASALPFIIGLADTTDDGTHYGYGRFAGTTLISYGFESVAGQAITISNTSLSAVPLPASAPLFGAALLAVGAFGYGWKRKAATAA